MAPDYLLLAFGRATVFTSASAIVAWLLLRSARVGSPKIHRAAWFLVVAQGWLLFPWVWQIEMPSTEPNAVIATIERTTNASLPFNTAISINESQSDVGTPLTWEHIALAISVVWFFGAALIALSRTLQYVRFVRRVRDSNADTDAHWNWEWQRQLRATRIRQRVELRMTGEWGPLLCYVPFRYLVLVPRALWSALTRAERQVILRHELAHLVRRDLWWALAIRVLALPQWFNPLVWYAVGEFDAAGEWACDDLVARRGRELVLARSLLSAAEYVTATAPGTVGAQGGELSLRVRRLVLPRFKEETMTKRLLVLVPLAAIAAVQLVRIEYIEAAPANIAGKESSLDSIDESVKSTDNPRGYGGAPYIIESHDVLSIGQVTLVGIRQLEQADLPTGQLIVWPDGRIYLGDFGGVYVSGMTVNQAQIAIKKQLLAAKKFNDVKFDLHVDSVNSKKVYVILQGIGQGDFAQAIVCPPGTTVSKVLQSAVWPQPVDLIAAKIWVTRPAPQGIGLEQILPVNWEDVLHDRSMATNHELHPCDRLFISTLKERENLPKPPRKTQLSLAKSLSTPSAEMELRSAAVTTVNTLAQIQFEIEMIEDRANNLAEFDAKRGDAQFAVFDSDTIRPALRILAKHELIKKFSFPKIACNEGQMAVISSNDASLNAAAVRFDGGLMLQLGLTTTYDEKHYKSDLSIPVKAGQSVLVRVIADDWQSPVQEATPLYVLLTPSIVRETPPGSSQVGYYKMPMPLTAE